MRAQEMRMRGMKDDQEDRVNGLKGQQENRVRGMMDDQEDRVQGRSEDRDENKNVIDVEEYRRHMEISQESFQTVNVS